MDTRMVKRAALKAEWVKAKAATAKAKHDYERYAQHHGYGHRLTTVKFNQYMYAMHQDHAAFERLMDTNNYMR